MENQNLPGQEEMPELLTLTGDDGEEITFEYLDCIAYKGVEYLVLLPADEVETEIVILEIQPIDEENESYLAVEDPATLDAVYGIFKERYRDILTFAD